MSSDPIRLIESPRLSMGRAATAPVLLAAALVVAVLAAQLSLLAFVVAGLALLAMLAYAAFRSPRVVLTAVVLAPLFDRYLIASFIPRELHTLTNFFSEGLLLLVALVIAARALRQGTLLPALRHPAVPFVVGFAVVGALSAVINRVPPLVAVAGVLFTIESVALFFLPRMVGFGQRHAARAAGAFVVVATIAAVLAIAQIVVAPTVLGMEVSRGRFGEGGRVAAFFSGNPNMLGAVLAMALPFPAFVATHLTGRRRWLAIGLVFIFALALLYTFSRGAWLSVGVAMVVVGLLLDRRALLLVVVVAALAYGSAHVIPRNLLTGVLGTGGVIPQVELDLGEATIGRVGAIGAGRDLRAHFIANALPIVADYPVLGAGPGRYGGAVAARVGNSPLHDEYRAGTAPTGRTVDNFWLHLLVEFGVLGVLMMVGLVVVAIGEQLIAAMRAPPLSRVLFAGFAAAGVVLAVDSLTEMLMEGNTTSFSMWFFLGVGSALAAWHRMPQIETTAAAARPAAVPEPMPG